MNHTDAAKELGSMRRRLQKAEIEVLLSRELVSEAIDVVSTIQPDQLALDVMSLLLTLFRQLRLIFESTTCGDSQLLSDLVHARIAPLLVPGQSIADLMITSLESNDRPRFARASDTLSAAARMVDSLAQPTTSSSSSINMLVPLFQMVSKNNITTRANLTSMNVMVEHIPSEDIPVDLLRRLLDEMHVTDSASIRCNIVASLMLRQHRSLDHGNPNKAETFFSPIVPLFSPDRPANTLLGLTRYLLPTLFATRPQAIPSLLSLLAQSTATSFAAWVSVAFLAVSSGHLAITDLPTLALQDAIAHADIDVRIRAFQLLVNTRDLLAPQVTQLIQQSMEYSCVLPSAGGRSEFVSAIYAFFKRLYELQISLKKGETFHTTRLEDAQKLHVWILERIIDSGLTVACRQPAVRAILALRILGMYLDVFGGDTSIQRQVFTHTRVQALFACQAAEFTEIRTRARKILEAAKTPLPGYESLDTAASRTLMTSALSSTNYPRNVQAEAGKSALFIMFQNLLQQPSAGPATTSAGAAPEAIDFVQMLVDKLEIHLQAAEESLAGGIEKMPLQGIIAAVCDVVSCIDLSSPSSQRFWKPMFHRLVGMIDRIWTVTRTVISLVPSIVPDGDASCPDHEIARAYEVLGGGEDGEEEEGTMDHTSLLSGCWRATKEAGGLLSILLALPINQAKEKQVMWTDREIDAGGRRFLTWLHEIRHRGTFSKVAMALSRLVDAVKTVDSLRHLCVSWLQNQLDIISTESISTTRRSAALPYSVLAIVASDQILLDMAIDRLDHLVRVDNTQSSDVTKVHAFNTLKIVLLDARQTKLLDRYFERAVMTALHAFSSANWNVRNVGLILISTLVYRSLSPARGTQDYYASRTTLATRQTLAQWHTKYPRIIPYIIQYLLETAPNNSSSTSINAHSPLFPILIIVRSLRWSGPGAKLAKDLRNAVEPYLNSSEWQVRAVAAQALSSVISGIEGLAQIFGLGLNITDAKPETSNALHGRLLLLRHLIAEVVMWQEVDETSFERVQDLLHELLRRVNEAETAPMITKAILDCFMAYVEESRCTRNLCPLFDAASQVVQQISKRNPTLPSQSLLLESCAKLRLMEGADSSHTSIILMRSGNEIESLLALESVSVNSQIQTLAALRTVLRTAMSKQSGHAVRIAASETISNVRWKKDDLQAIASVQWSRFADGILELVERSKNVPLREAALATLGLVLSQCWLADPVSFTGDERMGRFVDFVTAASDVKQSQPTRLSALKALSFLTSFLYPSKTTLFSIPASLLVNLHQIVLHLLQDDDEEIRKGTAEMVVSGTAGSNRPVCHDRAMELEWKWIGECLSSGQAGWVDMVWAKCLDANEMESELARTIRRAGAVDVLFEIEPPNLFRDPLIDVYHASHILARYPNSLQGRQSDKLRAHHARIADIIKEREMDEISPIDDAFDAMRMLKMRMEMQRMVWAKGY